MNKTMMIVVFALLLPILAGCSQQDGSSSFKSYNDYTQEQHKKILYERILGVWDSMAKQDYARQYSYYDPVTRSRIKKEDFIRGRNKNFHYYKPELKEVIIHGRIADVRVAVDVEITQMKIAGGRTYDLPRNRRVLKEIWLWMDGNWVREYKNSKQSFVSY